MTVEEIRETMKNRAEWLLTDLSYKAPEQRHEMISVIIKLLKEAYEIGQDHPYTDL